MALMHGLVILHLAIAAGAPDPGLAAQQGESPDAGGETVRLALMHGIPEKWNVEANWAVFLRMVERASSERAQILITPECWLDGYAAADKASTPERLREVAQDVASSPYLAQVAREARTHRIYICFGFTSLEGGDGAAGAAGSCIYNAAGLWDSEGQMVGIYHKTHIQTHDRQFAPGQALPVWPTRWGPVGILICADRRWPESARVLRLQGARLILNPTYGFHGELNTAMMRTRAYENECFIAFTHPGEGLVTGPKGQIVAQRKASKPGLLVCEIDLAQESGEGHIADRRPELYGVISRVPAERAPSAPAGERQDPN